MGIVSSTRICTDLTATITGATLVAPALASAATTAGARRLELTAATPKVARLTGTRGAARAATPAASRSAQVSPQLPYQIRAIAKPTSALLLAALLAFVAYSSLYRLGYTLKCTKPTAALLLTALSLQLKWSKLLKAPSTSQLEINFVVAAEFH